MVGIGDEDAHCCNLRFQGRFGVYIKEAVL